MKEIWKDVVGYEGLYQVSNFGNVKSLDRSCINKLGSLMFFLGKPINKRITRGGYYSVELNKNSKGITYTVHRLVATAFIKNTLNKPQINHINSIRTDNRVENLEWVNNSENQKHAFKFGNQSSKHRIKSVLQISEDDLLISEFESATEAARQLNLNQAKISACAMGKRKHTGGFKWKFSYT